MKIPPRPPALAQPDIGKIVDWFFRLKPTPTIGGRYIHWDKLRRLQPPETLDSVQWWSLIKITRQSGLKPLPLKDVNGKAFQYGLPDPAGEMLHNLDKDAAGQILVSDAVTSSEVRDRYVISSLMEEAITSSQLEGAATTRVIAKEMLRSGRAPRDRSERMIANNYAAMRRIQTLKDQEFTPEAIIELQRILTHDAIDEPTGVGRLRRADETIRVEDGEGQTLHTPPPADELQQRLQTMCDFANATGNDTFVHPVVRAIILHFWLAYDHPFVDGNGRCARALFYWSMLRAGYWLFEFVSISNLIRKAPIQYGRAFLYTETDANDLTYFVFYHLELIRKGIDQLREYLGRKMAETRAVRRILQNSQRYNHRQLALLSHAVRNPDASYTVASHQASHGIVHQTARGDLYELVKLNLLSTQKNGRAHVFWPATDIEQRMKRLS